MVAGERFALPTQAFSGLCSTPELSSRYEGRLKSKRYTPPSQIVWRNGHFDAITSQYTDAVFPKFAANDRLNGMTIV